MTKYVLWKYSLVNSCWRMDENCYAKPVAYDLHCLRFRKYCGWVAVSTEEIPSAFFPVGYYPMHRDDWKKNSLKVDSEYLKGVKAGLSKHVLDAVEPIQTLPPAVPLSTLIKTMPRDGSLVEASISIDEYKLYSGVFKGLQRHEIEGKVFISFA